MANDINTGSEGIDNIDWSNIESKDDFDQALNDAFDLDESNMLDTVVTQGIAMVGGRYMMEHINEMKKSMNTEE